MKKSILILSILCLQLTLVFADDKDSLIKEYIAQFELEKKNIQGGAVAIISSKKIVYKSTFGFQKNQQFPITEHTLFPIASVSKAISATGLALLVNENRINLTKEYKLDYIKPKITLEHVLSHTTGYQFPGNDFIEKGISRKNLLLELKKKKPVCKVGKCYFYSNTNYSLLEEILKKNNYSIAKVISILQAKLDTDEIQIAPLSKNKELAYPHENSKALPFPPYYSKTTISSSGIFMSLDAAIKVLQLQLGYRPDLISQVTLNKFHKPIIINQNIQNWIKKGSIKINKEFESYYGLGWRIVKSSQPGPDLIFHSGYIAGITSFIGMIPEKDLAIVILVNQESPFAMQQGINLWEKF